MDRVGDQAVTQISLEEDINLPENKPDVNLIYLQRARLVVEEARAVNGVVNIRGRLHYSLLYQTLERGSSLVRLEGGIPFEEKIRMDEVSASDPVLAQGTVEDLTINLINTRKLQLQSVITLKVWTEKLTDLAVPIGVSDGDSLEYRRQSFPVAQMTVDKRDVLRIREEISLPAHYPNIYQILWSNIAPGDLEFKVSDGRILARGDVQLFLIYEGEGEDRPIRSFETAIPFSNTMECSGCEEGMLPDISYELVQQDLTVKPDQDGEERKLELELSMDLRVHIYREESVEIVTDLYGVSSDVETVTEEASLQQVLTKVTGKSKLSERIRVAGDKDPILQILHSEGEIVPESEKIVENGILLQGVLDVKVMYVTGDDETPYACTGAKIPYQYTLEVPGIKPEDVIKIFVTPEQLQVAMLDGEEMDAKAVLSFSTIVLRRLPIDLISEVKISPPDHAKLRRLPGIIIYTVRKGDSLWSIGRKYYVSVDSLKEWNNLTDDELQIGQKLLIVKEVPEI